MGAGTGKIVGARDFESANSEYFSRADNADLSTGDISFTGACWVKMESVALSGIVTKGPYNVGADSEYGLGIVNVGSGDRFVFDVRASAFANNFVQASNYGALSTGVWAYIVFWHDATANSIGIQVNNGTANTASYSNGVRDGTQAFEIGRYGSSGYYFDGLIEQVAFWKRILTSDEKTELYNSGNGLAYSSWAGGGGGGTAANLLIHSQAIVRASRW